MLGAGDELETCPNALGKIMRGSNQFAASVFIVMFASAFRTPLLLLLTDVLRMYVTREFEKDIEK